MSILHSFVANEFFYGDRKEAALFFRFGFDNPKRFKKNGFDFLYCEKTDLGDFIVCGDMHLDDCYLVTHNHYFEKNGDFGSFHTKIIQTYEIMSIDEAHKFYEKLE